MSLLTTYTVQNMQNNVLSAVSPLGYDPGNLKSDTEPAVHYVKKALRSFAKLSTREYLDQTTPSQFSSRIAISSCREKLKISEPNPIPNNIRVCHLLPYILRETGIHRVSNHYYCLFSNSGQRSTVSHEREM